MYEEVQKLAQNLIERNEHMHAPWGRTLAKAVLDLLEERALLDKIGVSPADACKVVSVLQDQIDSGFEEILKLENETVELHRKIFAVERSLDDALRDRDHWREARRVAMEAGEELKRQRDEALRERDSARQAADHYHQQVEVVSAMHNEVVRERDVLREALAATTKSANRADDGYWDAWGQVEIERGRTRRAIIERDQYKGVVVAAARWRTGFPEFIDESQYIQDVVAVIDAVDTARAAGLITDDDLQMKGVD